MTVRVLVLHALPLTLRARHVYEYYAVLGRPADSCTELARLNPRVGEDGFLICESVWASDPELAQEMVYAEILDLLGVHARSEGRFFNQGPVSRDILVLVTLGIDTVIERVLDSNETENTFLGGWKFFDASMRSSAKRVEGYIFQLCLHNRLDCFGVREVSFAFPFGCPYRGFASEGLVEQAKLAGVTCSLTTEAIPVDLRNDPFHWGRFNAFPWDNAASLAAKVEGWYEWAPRLRRRVSRAVDESQRNDSSGDS